MFREFFWTIFLGIHVGFILPAGILTLASLYGWAGVIPFVAANLALAYFFNKARKTGRAGEYDDKIGSGRMGVSSTELVAMIRKQRETDQKASVDDD